MCATIKARLLTPFRLTSRERAARLLGINGLGDRKPSQLLAEMRSLPEGHTSCLLFEEIFLRQLPEDVRMQLSNQNFTNLDNIASLADILWQVKSVDVGITEIKEIADERVSAIWKSVDHGST
ncbi:hypothetical protein HZS_31 [Henneguya salminicola]|nr:hypothetical protein HZS_31 [Henneguya salminicola]